MAKVMWGSAAKDLQTAMENFDPDENASGYTNYNGPEPKKGTYPYKIVRAEKTESKNGFPQFILHLEMDPELEHHMKYKGHYLRDYMTFTPDTAFRTRPFLDAIGATPAELIGKTVTNADDEVMKIGRVAVPGTRVMCNIWKKGDDEYFNVRFLPLPDNGTTGDDSDNAPTGDDPF